MHCLQRRVLYSRPVPERLRRGGGRRLCCVLAGQLQQLTRQAAPLSRSRLLFAPASGILFNFAKPWL